MRTREPLYLPRLILLYALVVAPVYAHAILLSATPKVNQVVSGPKVTIRLHFNSRVDSKRSRITLIGPGGAQSPVAIEQQKSPDWLVGEVQGLKPGSYILRWQVLALDGHITRGDLPFQVS